MDNGMPETGKYRIPQLRRSAANELHPLPSRGTVFDLNRYSETDAVPWRKHPKGIRGHHFSGESCVRANESLPRPSVGFWLLSFEPDVKDSSGRTELDKVWTEIKKLVAEGVLIQAAYIIRSNRVQVDCQVKDYTDTEDVFESATRLREKIDYIYPMYMKTETCRNASGRNLLGYMHCVDGDLYENTGRGFKLLKRFCDS